MKKLYTIFLILTAFLSFGQKGSINGFVFDEATGQPMIYTNVYLKGTTYGSITDPNGYYAISNVPEGKYQLVIQYLGYDSLEQHIEIIAHRVIAKNLHLTQKNVTLNTVEISGESAALKTDTRVSVLKVTPKNIKQIPAIGGQADIAQYMQVLPGIVSSGDQGGQLYIRGGAPIESKMLLDGMIVYNPFHSIGLFSVFDNDIIQTVDIYTGGFNAEYGGRISAVTDIKTRSGRKDRLAGKLDLSALSSKLLIEGPLSNNESKESNTSFLVSMKSGYIDKSAETLYDNFGYEEGLPYNFNDFYGKISLGSKSGNKIDLFGFHFDDRVDYSISKYHWTNNGFGSSFIYVPRNSTTIMRTNFAYSSYKNNYTDPLNLNHFSDIKGFNMNFNFRNIIDKHEVAYGIEMIGFKTEFLSHISPHTFITESNNSSEMAVFIKTKLTLGALIVEPGVHFHYYPSFSLKRLSPEPRFTTKLNATEWLRFKAAGGIYSQNLTSSQSSRDIVNHFYGFISSSENLPETFQGEKIEFYQQKAKHIIAGAEIDLLNSLHLNIEGYYKDYLQLTSINKDKIYPDNKSYEDKADHLKKDFIIEDGFAKGIDVSLKFRRKGLNILSAYSLGFTKRKNEIYSYFPPFDRRHNVNVMANYNFGKNNSYTAGARWNLGSGFPYTKLIGFYPGMTMEDAVSNLYYTQYADETGLAYSEYNESRLPTYHRLDISLNRNFDLNNRMKLEINGGVTNFYNQKNIFYTSFKTGKRIYQLPMMFNLGASLSF